MHLDQTDIRQLILKHFPQLSEKGLIDEIVEQGKPMFLNEGEKMVDYGSYIRMVPLVIEGTIKVLRQDEGGNELFLYYLQAGDTCSMSFSCCMMEKQSIIRTIVEEDAFVIAIPMQYVDQWISQYRSWKNFIMLSYDHKMFELIQTIDRIAFKKLDERLIDYLRKKATALQNQMIQTTHQQIAYDLNTSREAISRLLKKMEKEGLIALGRNYLELKLV